MHPLILDIKAQLRQKADEKIRESTHRFFKEKVQVYGLKSAEVTRLARDSFKTLDLSKKEIFLLCEQLWASGYLEESFIACHWSYALSRQFEPEDFATLEGWLYRYVTNWASCDTLCNHSIGTFLESYPEFVQRLMDWCDASSLWVRRGAAVSLILPAKKGLFKEDIFRIAEKLLLDPEDLVQKGYGWMLKALSQASMEEVFCFIMENKARMPRTALRYALEKMPSDKRKKAMEKEEKKL